VDDLGCPGQTDCEVEEGIKDGEEKRRAGAETSEDFEM
jgi:hypothetical protein